MSIIVIEGSSSDAFEHAQMLRSAQISRGRGALLVLEPDGDEHKVQHQIEKILAGTPFPDEVPQDLSKMRWKEKPTVLVPAELEDVLDQFDEVLPGFTKYFGPISRMTADSNEQSRPSKK